MTFRIIQRQKKSIPADLLRNTVFRTGGWTLLFCSALSAATVEENLSLSLPPAALQQDGAARNLAEGDDRVTRYASLGSLAQANGDFAQARKFFYLALQETPSPELRHTFACRYLEAVVADAAIQDHLEQERHELEALQIVFSANELQGFQAKLLLAQGKGEEAQKLFEALSQKPEYSGNQAPELYYDWAAACSLSGNLPGARQILNRLLTLPGCTDVWKFQANLALTLNSLESGNSVEARKEFETLNESFSTLPIEQQEQLNLLNLLVLAGEGKFEVLLPSYRALAQSSAASGSMLRRLAELCARHAWEAKDYRAAADFYSDAFRFAVLEGDRRQLLKLLVDTELAGGDATRGAAALDRYLKFYPDNPEFFQLQLQEAALLMSLKRDKEAEALCRNVFEHSANAAERRSAALQLARYARSANASAEALSFYRFAAENSATETERDEARQLCGEYLYQLGEYQQASELFLALAAGKSAGSETGAFWAIQTLYQLRQYEQALEQCQRLLTAKNPAIRSKTGYLQPLLLERLGRDAEALAAYRAFAQGNPKAPEAAAALFASGVLASRIDSEEARALFVQYADLYPGENAANALYKALSEAYSQSDETAAEQLFQRLSKEYPKNKFTVGAAFLRSDFLRDRGRYADALAELDTIERNYATNFPELRAQILYDRALLFEKQNDAAKSRAALEVIVKDYSNSSIAPQAFYQLGDMESRRGEFEKAIDYYRQAEERGGNADFAAASAGRAADSSYSLYQRKKDDRFLKQAITGYETLLRNPELPPELRAQTLYKLGRSLEAANRAPEALNLYTEQLYDAVLARRAQRYYSEVWSAKSCHAAIEICLDQDTVEAARKAIELLHLTQELDLPDENEDERIQEIQDWFDL